MSSSAPNLDSALFKNAVRTLWPLAVYHRFTLHGSDQIPKTGRALVLCHHSAATYDMCLLVCETYRRTGRAIRSLADRTFFRFPPIARVFEGLGAVNSNPTTAKSLLEGDELVALAPVV